MATSHMENIALGCYFENVQKESIDWGLSGGKKIKRHSFERRFGFADGPLSIKHGVACLYVLLLENPMQCGDQSGNFEEGALKEI